MLQQAQDVKSKAEPMLHGYSAACLMLPALTDVAYICGSIKFCLMTSCQSIELTMTCTLELLHFYFCSFKWA